MRTKLMSLSLNVTIPINITIGSNFFFTKPSVEDNITSSVDDCRA